MKYYLLLATILVCNISFGSDNESIRLLSTTSTRDSGLLQHLLPNFEKKYKIRVHVVALGTGQALQAAKNCDGDILLTHAPNLEKDFIARGYGESRDTLMYNDFVIIGPKQDPANIKLMKNVSDVFKRISDTASLFISRGDGSGTNISEENIWKTMGFIPKNSSGQWYLESGQGMGSTINIAIGKDAYTYADRATWLKFKNKANHSILFEGDRLMFNQYGLVRLNPEKCINAKNISIDYFYKWLISQEGQFLIGQYTYEGSQLFIPNYGVDND